MKQSGTATIMVLFLVMMLGIITHPFMQHCCLLHRFAVQRLHYYERLWFTTALMRHGINELIMSADKIAALPTGYQVALDEKFRQGRLQGSLHITQVENQMHLRASTRTMQGPDTLIIQAFAPQGSASSRRYDCITGWSLENKKE